jgi:excisionase family DNA binding protein
MEEFEPLLDAEEAARLLKMHPKTIQKLARQGEVVGVRVGRYWRFRVSALNLFLQLRTGKPVHFTDRENQRRRA